MPLIETLITAVGGAVAKTTLKRWLEDDVYARDISTSILGVLQKKIPDLLTRSKAERDFKRIAETVGQQLIPFIENEAGSLPENEQEAAALAVADTFDKARIDDKILFEVDLNPKALTDLVRAANPSASRHLNEATTSLYDKMLAECSAYVIEITSALPSFGHKSTGELLKREGQIAELVEKVLAELPKLRSNDNGENADISFENDYRREIARKLDKLELFGIATEEMSQKYSLSVAYITLSATGHSSGNEAVGNEAVGNEAVGNETLRNEDDNGVDLVRVDHALSGSQRILIRGEAGSGKTTLLQWLAVRAARQDFEGVLEGWNGQTPFFVQLRRWLDSGLPKPEQFLDLVTPNITGIKPNGWVTRQLQAGALLLIDGIDEVPQDRRESVRRWIEDLIGSFQNSRIVATSRPAAAKNGWLSSQGFDDTELQPMDLTDIEALIEQWHEAARQELGDDERVSQLENYKVSLRSTIRKNRPIRNLATTPLLCAMICTLHLDRRKNIPNDRMRLYRVALELMLDRRDTEREGDFPEFSGLGQDIKEALLRGLAWWLMLAGRSDASRSDMEKRLAHDQQLVYDVDRDPAELLQFLLERSGLLRESVKGRIDFIHRTFQEYLAAWQAIREQHVNFLVDNADLAEWRETIILAAGHAYLASESACTQLLEGLLRRAESEPNNKHQMILLAVACLGTATGLSREIKYRVRRILGDIMPPRKVAEGRAIAAAGDLAIPYLDVPPEENHNTIRACITALGLIGGDDALHILRKFTGDRRLSVRKALIAALCALDQIGVLIEEDKELEELDFSGFDFDSLVLIKKCTNLKLLRLDGTQVSDLTPVAELNYLKQLWFNDTDVIDLGPLTGLTRLEGLWLCNTPVCDIAPLNGLTNLQLLWLDGTQISDLSSLASCFELKQLSLNTTKIHDLRPLAHMTKLKGLSLHGTEIGHLSPLVGMTKLEGLRITNTQVDDIGALAGLTGLKRLYLKSTQVRDLAPLAGITSLQHLWLDDSQYANVSALDHIEGLTIHR